LGISREGIEYLIDIPRFVVLECLQNLCFADEIFDGFVLAFESSAVILLVDFDDFNRALLLCLAVFAEIKLNARPFYRERIIFLPFIHASVGSFANKL
jgi:hypothetical protein